MLRALILLLLSFVRLPAIAVAADRLAPYLDKLFPLIQKQLQAGDERYGWSTIGSGVYVFRFMFDIDKDGSDELFVTNSFNTFRTQATWNVYRLDSGSPVAIDGELECGLFHSYFDNSASVPTFFTIGDEANAIHEHLFRVKVNKLYHEDLVISEERANDIYAKINSGQDYIAIKPKVEAILLAELLTDPNATWRRIDEKTVDPSDDFVKIAGDEKLVAKYANFSPRDAYNLINLLRNGIMPVRPVTSLNDGAAAQPGTPAITVKDPAHVAAVIHGETGIDSRYYLMAAAAGVFFIFVVVYLRRGGKKA